MATLYKRDTLIKTICLMGLMAAINVVFTLLTSFVPLLSVLLIIFLPLTSAVIEITCKDRYFPIYFFATIGLSAAVSALTFDFAFFYVIPSMITGYIFGLMSKKNLPDMLSIFIASVFQTILSFAFVPVIELVTEVNIIDYAAKLFHINDRFVYDNSIILIFFLIALVQTILSFIVVDNELKKMKMKSVPIFRATPVAFLGGIIAIILAVSLSFVSLPISYFCLGIAWYFAVFCFIFAAQDKDKIYMALTGFTVLVNILLFAAFNQSLEKGYSFLLIGITPLMTCLLSLAFYFLKKQKQ